VLDFVILFIDAIEIFNSRCIFSRFNTRAKEFSQQHHLLGIVGSDSHNINEVGTATLTLPDFIDAESLKTSLALAQPHLKLSAPWVHFFSRRAALQKRVSQ
jgi:predicted metal-dependent phosphoesterase TrpH